MHIYIYIACLTLPYYLKQITRLRLAKTRRGFEFPRPRKESVIYFSGNDLVSTYSRTMGKEDSDPYFIKTPATIWQRSTNSNIYKITKCRGALHIKYFISNLHGWLLYVDSTP